MYKLDGLKYMVTSKDKIQSLSFHIIGTAFRFEIQNTYLQVVQHHICWWSSYKFLKI